jgi:molybdate transport system substrate-binding protein
MNGKRMKKTTLLFCYLAAILGLSLQLARADMLYLYSAAGMKAPSEQIVKAFESRSGHNVLRHYDTAGAAEQAQLAALKADKAAHSLLITTLPRIVQASAPGGPFQAGVHRPVGDTLAGVAISAAFAQRTAAAGTKTFQTNTPDALKAVLLSAQRIAFSDPQRGATVGQHFLSVISQLNIKEEVLAKAVLAKDGIETMRLVQTGAVDVGITQVSEIVQTEAARLLGAFPKELELATRYSLWHSDQASKAVKDLAAALTSAEARVQLEQNGLRAP